MLIDMKKCYVCNKNAVWIVRGLYLLCDQHRNVMGRAERESLM